MERRLTNGLVSAVIVTWNSAPFLRRCLAALAAQTYPNVELIHVDNASADDSVAIVREGAKAQHIINDTNRGFSAAVNQAVRIAKGEFVLLLNPDAYLAPDYVSSLVAALTGEGFGMATGKLLQADSGLIDSKGIRMTRSGRHFDIGSSHPTPDPRPPTPTPKSSASPAPQRCIECPSSTTSPSAANFSMRISLPFARTPTSPGAGGFSGGERFMSRRRSRITSGR
jgi:GT2 family glycosyltransferase